MQVFGCVPRNPWGRAYLGSPERAKEDGIRSRSRVTEWVTHVFVGRGGRNARFLSHKYGIAGQYCTDHRDEGSIRGALRYAQVVGGMRQEISA